MVTKLKLENKTGKQLDICVEPLAEFIDWEIDKSIDLELELTTDKYQDELVFSLSDDTMVIYECRQYQMKVFIDKELKYSTPPGRYV